MVRKYCNTDQAYPVCSQHRNIEILQTTRSNSEAKVNQVTLPYTPLDPSLISSTAYYSRESTTLFGNN